MKDFYTNFSIGILVYAALFGTLHAATSAGEFWYGLGLFVGSLIGGALAAVIYGVLIWITHGIGKFTRTLFQN